MGKDALETHPKISFSDILQRHDYNDVRIHESAKVTKVLGVIRKWCEEAPDEKIILFTQWRKFAATMARFLEKDRIPFIYYTVSNGYWA
jgi:ERCC4-related helicase